MLTRKFEVRLQVPGQPKRREVVKIPAGRKCTISRPEIRGDTGAKLMPGYVQVHLDEPIAGRRIFFTDERNLQEDPEDKKPEPCDSCDNLGWFVAQTQGSSITPDGTLEIERCDDCERFKSDEDAEQHVLSRIVGNEQYVEAGPPKA